MKARTTSGGGDKKVSVRRRIGSDEAPVLFLLDLFGNRVLSQFALSGRHTSNRLRRFIAKVAVSASVSSLQRATARLLLDFH
ncbi:hypothetical protein DHL47_04355 [Streptococcus panodentis]|uniref:Uncharacterized protein n=1 Tax=Streptococcus panodentis TaxID=1581472 RepID=A0ABS5AVI3_9STRE|nr:hypothetical protein [Streptococcus panodentis]